MSKKINKISQLKNLESFLQINYLKGFKYIDKVGEILNLYQSELGEIQYNMSPTRLIIPKPLPDIEEIKISNVDLWCHFVEPKNLGNAESIYLNEVTKILNILGVEKVVRTGWRNYFIHELPNKPNDLNSLSKITKISTQELTFKQDLMNNVKSSIRVKLLKQKDNEKIVLFFDLDVYMENKFNINESFKSFGVLRKAIESTEVLDIVNEIIQHL